MSVNEVADKVKIMLKDRTPNISAFQHGNVEKAHTSVSPRRRRLLEGTVNTRENVTTVRVIIISTTTGENAGNSLQRNFWPRTKTDTRFLSKHSVAWVAVYDFATTVLSTHFIVGPTSVNLSKFWSDKLKSIVVETMEWVWMAPGANSIYPVNPNLSIAFYRQRCLFYIRGMQEQQRTMGAEARVSDKGSSSNFRSDFVSGEDAEHKGGLCVHLTVNNIAVAWLTNAELRPNLWPNGILVTKVSGLCKGGGDISNSDFGPLVFLWTNKR